MRRPSPSRRTPSSGKASLALFGAGCCLAFAVLLVARFAVESRSQPAASSSVIVSLAVAFCNSDLVCDPEENYDSCPSDCAAPEPEPEPEPGTETDTGGGGNRRSSRHATTTPATTTAPVVAPEAGPTQAPSSPTTVSSTPPLEGPALAISLTASATRVLPETVEVTWRGSDWAEIRVLRGDDAFPTAPDEGGIVVYEGRGSGFTDDEPGQGIYSIFVRQPDGSYSPAIHVSAPPTAHVPGTGASPDYVFESWWPAIISLALLLLLLVVLHTFRRRRESANA